MDKCPKHLPSSNLHARDFISSLCGMEEAKGYLSRAQNCASRQMVNHISETSGLSLSLVFFFFLFPSSCGCVCSDISFKFLSSILRFSHMCTMRKKIYSPAPIHMNLSISSQHNPPNFKPFLKNNPLNTMNAFHMCVSMIQPLEHGKLKSGYILNR